MNGELEPRVQSVVLAHDAARRLYPKLDERWQDRMRVRRRIYGRVVRWLEQEGALGEGVSPARGVGLMFALLRQRVYEDLVGTAGWSRRRYAEHVGALLRRALLG